MHLIKSLALPGGAGLVLLIALISLALKFPTRYLQLILLYETIGSTSFANSRLHQSIQIASLNIYFTDIFTLINSICILALITGNAKIFIKNEAKHFGMKLKKYRFPIEILALQTMLTLAVFSAISILGLKQGWNLWRLFSYSFSLYSYVYLQGKRIEMEYLLRIAKIALIIELLIVNVTYVLHGIGSSSGVNLLTGEDSGRATNSSGALFILISIILILVFGKKSKFENFLIVIGLIDLILLQQRTVWLTSLAVALYFTLSNEVLKLPKLIKLTIFATSALFLWYVVKLSSNLSTSAQSTTTFTWRLNRWHLSFKVPRTTLEWFFGGTFGPTPFQNGVSGVLVYFAHNFVLIFLESFGWVGVSLITLYIVRSLLFRLSKPNRELRNLLVVICFTYGFAYFFEPIIWIALALIASQRQNADQVLER